MQQKNCLIIFTRYPELGKGKRRLAATVGDQVALEVYQFLLQHTKAVTQHLPVTKQIWYAEGVHLEDQWPNTIYQKYEQSGEDLGQRMRYALEEALKSHDRAIVIGSDLYDLREEDLQAAFTQLEQREAIIGPALDGGYYLLGFHKKVPAGVFEGKAWGTDSVYEDTMQDLAPYDTVVLPVRNDVDYYEDIKDVAAFAPILNKKR